MRNQPLPNRHKRIIMMKAMILAAGRGERMRPLTDHTPKPLLSIGNETLIERHIRRLKQAGIEEIIINHAWLGKKIETTLGNGKNWGVRIHYSAEHALGLETAGGIARALPLLGDKPFLVVNGDIFTDFDFNLAYRAQQQLQDTQSWGHIWLVDNPDHHPNGDFDIHTNGMVVPQTRGTFSGIGVYTPKLFQNVPPDTPTKLAQLLSYAIENNRLIGQWYHGLWLDVGTPERLAQAHHLNLSKQSNPNNQD